MAELGDFLRTRRARLQPQDVGLPDYGRRRVPGLRREELAQLAGVSVDYYVRLEQGRDIQPSDSVLDAIAGALRLDDDERAHLFTLVRPRRRARRRPTERVRPGVQRLVERIEFPAFVIGRRMDVLACNALAAALLGGLREPQPAALRLPRRGRPRRSIPSGSRSPPRRVAFLRLSAGEDPDDAQLVELIGELSLHSEAFRRLWARHDVKSKTFGVKRFEHPQVGPLELDYESLKLARRRPDARDLHGGARQRRPRPRWTLLAPLGREEDRGGVGDDDRVLEVRRR